MWYLVPFRGIDVGEESEPFRVSSTLIPNSITRDTITYFVDDQGHRLLTKGRWNSIFIFSHPDIPVADLRAVWNEPAANERGSFTMKKKNIYTNQSQELLTLFEEAGNGAKVMCVPIDYAKKDHVAMLCNGHGHILRKPFSVKNSLEGIEYLSNLVKRIRTEEPDEGNLHVRVCGGSAGQPVLLPGSWLRTAALEGLANLFTGALNNCFYFEKYFIRPLHFVKKFSKLKTVISSTRADWANLCYLIPYLRSWKQCDILMLCQVFKYLAWMR